MALLVKIGIVLFLIESKIMYLFILNVSLSTLDEYEPMKTPLLQVLSLNQIFNWRKVIKSDFETVTSLVVIYLPTVKHEKFPLIILIRL